VTIDLNPLIDRLGREQFEEACVQARHFAPRTGNGVPRGEECSFEITHDLCWLIWDEASATAREKVEATLTLYEQLPDYGVLLYLALNFEELDPPARDVMWAAYRRWLSDPDATLAAPVALSLACDFFEDGNRVEEAWRALVRPEAPDRLLARVLDVARLMPWIDKAPIYERLRGVGGRQILRNDR
jgi:hypothetical protein